ncbi:MAG: YkvA family protein [Bacteroidota bacterium]|nr:YkvA family protein [Bacteroidota bacterium]
MLKKISPEQAENKITHNADEITKADITTIIKKEDAIQNKFIKNDSLKSFVSDFKLLFSMLKDNYLGKYKSVPWWTITAVAGSLLYVLNPIDIIPDFIPGVGYIDDAVIMGSCIKMISADLEKYKVWKTNTQ